MAQGVTARGEEVLRIWLSRGRGGRPGWHLLHLRDGRVSCGCYYALQVDQGEIVAAPDRFPCGHLRQAHRAAKGDEFAGKITAETEEGRAAVTLLALTGTHAHG